MNIPAGYSLIRTGELERLQEIASAARGRFPRGEVIKPDRDQDCYVVWSHSCEAPSFAGTRARMLAADCPESRLRRADETGSSFMPGEPGCWWDDTGLIAEQRGWLPRASLLAYATAYLENRMSDAWDLLEPLDGTTEVRRG